MAKLVKKDSEWEKARFYEVEGVEYPSVTTILGVIDKSAPLMHWAANQERKAFQAALLEVLTAPGVDFDPQHVYDEIVKRSGSKKAWLASQDEAATIGKAAHALIEWHTWNMLGGAKGEAPAVPDQALWAVEAWKDWVKAVDFTPLYCELMIWCAECGYAGTLDWIAKVNGIVTLGDIKTGKAVYPEAFLQNVAYRHAAQALGIETERGMILRLPKVTTDPAFEAVEVPAMPYGYFVSASRLWRWQRTMDGKKTGKAMGKCALASGASLSPAKPSEIDSVSRETETS